VLGLRDLNRTLLLRQHLLERASMPALPVVEHLLGLQAQEGLSPYLSLAARVEGFDPGELSDALEHGAAVRLMAMRGTIHVLTPDDARTLRHWLQDTLDRQGAGTASSRPAQHLPPTELLAAVREALRDGPLPVQQLGERLALRFPGVPAQALAHVARERVPLVQVPPRGLWRGSGAVVYRLLEDHPGRATPAVDVPELVRRYLRAFGPATAADLTTWSRVTRLGPVVASMREELVEVRCEDGRTRYDVPGAPYADGDRHAPVRLLGLYDNLWLSHADRERVAPPEARSRWTGPNGAMACTVFVDGFMAGLWRQRQGRVEVDVPGRLTRRQRAELDDEVARIGSMLARP